MTLEQAITALIDPLAPGRVWWNTPPDNVDRSTAFIICQVVGGRRYRYVENDTLVEKRHSRVQFEVWSPRVLEASEMATQLENTIVSSGMISEVLTAPFGLNEPALKLHGMRQDFGFHHAV